MKRTKRQTRVGENEMNYAEPDGLILVALYGADRDGSGAALPAIVAYAEMLTHSAPSATELSQALTRFLLAGSR